MEALDQPIALRMVGSGLLVADVQRAEDSTQQAQGELGTSVRCDDVWHLKRATHSSSSTLAHVVADVSATGNASGHLVDLSMMVNRCVAPGAAGSGPMRSTWICEKRLCGTVMGSGSMWTCLVTFLH